MRWPFMLRSTAEADRARNAELWSRLIADREQRIRELESERRMLWDKVCLLGIGTPVFERPPVIAEPAEEPKKPMPAEPQIPLRPSAIMNRESRNAEARWLRKFRPAVAAKADREKVMSQFDQAHQEGAEAGRAGL